MGTSSFGQAELGDKRRTKRLVKMAQAFQDGACCGGGGTITSVIPSAAHQAKAAYRLLDCEQVTHEAVLGGHVKHVREALAEPGEYLLIEDTTTMDYHCLKQARGLGPIGESYTRGYWLHSTLAVRWEESGPAEIVGLAAQQAWARPPEHPPRRKSNGRGKESNQARQKRPDRESRRWASVLKELPRNDQTQFIYTADRESDIYEVFQECRINAVSLVIRAAYPRALDGNLEGMDLMSAVGQGRLLGTIEVHLARENRTATLQVRSTQVELRGPQRPGGRLPNLMLNVVQAREINPPAGSEPIGWTLLTDLPVGTLKQCLKVIRIYCSRWLIEEFHKALKTGLKLEQSQLSDYRRLSALGAIVSVVAVFLLQCKASARTNGEAEVDRKKVDPAMLEVLNKLFPLRENPTQNWFWISIARLGGFQARKGDGSPGWLTLWRGWQTLSILLRGYQLNTT